MQNRQISAPCRVLTCAAHCCAGVLLQVYGFGFFCFVVAIVLILMLFIKENKGSKNHLGHQV